jgi:hypothetical protein
MPKAREISIALHRIIDVLDLHPDLEIVRPSLTFFYGFEAKKDQFLATARILPHPVTKNYEKDTDRYSRVSVNYETDALRVSTSIYREMICRIVKPATPAEYDCDLTLSEAEDAALTEAR